MMKKSGSADYFGTFLDTLSSETPAADKAAATAPVQPPLPPPPGGPILPKILGYLSQAGESPITDIAAGIGCSLVETAEVVGKLQTSSLVVVTGDPGAERVELTEAGRNVADLA